MPFSIFLFDQCSLQFITYYYRIKSIGNKFMNLCIKQQHCFLSKWRYFRKANKRRDCNLVRPFSYDTA